MSDIDQHLIRALCKLFVCLFVVCLFAKTFILISNNCRGNKIKSSDGGKIQQQEQQQQQ